MNILVSRTDRAGDFILTLPIFRELKRAFPDAHIAAHIRKYTEPIARLCKEIDEVILDDDSNFEPGHLVSNTLCNSFKDHKFDKAIIVHPAGRSILATWRAGIPLRVGRASNVFMFFLNDRRIQKRSYNEKHEFEYNLDLLTGIVPNIDYKPYCFDFSEKQIKEGREVLENLGLKDSPIIVHPGHGGSAHNISPEMYGEIAEQLVSEGKSVMVSMGPGEEKMEEFFSALRSSGRIFFLKGISGMDKLAAIFKCCKGFVGGSTGPLHLAASSGIPCVAFFPPVKAMTPKRWGPCGSKSLIIKPELPDCDGKCERCKNKGCMKRINILNAVDWLRNEL